MMISNEQGSFENFPSLGYATAVRGMEYCLPQLPLSRHDVYHQGMRLCPVRAVARGGRRRDEATAEVEKRPLNFLVTLELQCAVPCGSFHQNSSLYVSLYSHAYVLAWSARVLEVKFSNSRLHNLRQARSFVVVCFRKTFSSEDSGIELRAGPEVHCLLFPAFFKSTAVFHPTPLHKYRPA